MIQVRNLTKTFKSFTAVKGISFDVEQGEIFALLGVLAAFLAGSWFLLLVAVGSYLIWRLVIVILAVSVKSPATEDAGQAAVAS